MNELNDPVSAGQTLCMELSVLFIRLINALSDAISRTGGKVLADQFVQQLNHFAGQHGWSVLTGLTDLTELRCRAPDVDARALLSVYLSYTQYARALAGRILGGQVLKSTLVALLNSLPPRLAQLNVQHGIIRLP